MTEITLFRFEDFDVVAALLDGEPQFAASQVAAALGYADTDQAVRKHCKAAKTYPVEMTGQVRNVKMIPERDVYRLILRSKKPTAEAFEEKVVGEILPSIRKTGGYKAAPAIDLNDPAFLRQTLLGYTEKVIALEAEITTLTPKAEGFDRFANSTGRTILREVGKALHIGSKRGIELLREKKWTFRAPNGKWHAYSAKVDAGLLDVKYVTYTNSVGEEISTQQVYVTPKGMARLALEMGQN
ncbi:phage antirepressor [Gluconobacter oxydans]|uniref:Phage-related DNA binding protein n=1 Tax=Gluconobacter oxydans (strain 621H) TaxID=290633 RepID=Q5FN44_GLUOX|nr:phage antirepressor KilAC domain-containing protein [Gluconobacter oxydans]AAW62203.1 Phage-related DNA binding protein [Gluconobacter oxydans 621H]